jgi:uncharacterized protein DUF1707
MTSTEPQTTETRCSDAEREKASTVLRDAAAEGRLSMEELEERLSAIYAARYRHELAAVSADLPQPTEHAGWTAVLTLAWHQLASDLTGLLRRDALSPRRKVVIALTILAAAAVLIGLVAMLMHGLFEDGGPEHHGYGD